MTLSADLWRDNLDLAEACLAHPFVRGLADGTLPRPRFAGYIGQDALFLESFARAYCIAAAKAPDADGFRAFHALAQGALDELTLHEGYARAWGIDPRAVTPLAATRHYTDFLLATAWGHDAGLTAAAMSPCMRLYAHLGQALARDGRPDDHPYGEWIATYSAADFAGLVEHLATLTDRYAAATPLTRTTYRHAMACEVAFFEAAWQGEGAT